MRAGCRRVGGGGNGQQESTYGDSEADVRGCRHRFAFEPEMFIAEVDDVDGGARDPGSQSDEMQPWSRFVEECRAVPNHDVDDPYGSDANPSAAKKIGFLVVRHPD